MSRNKVPPPTERVTEAPAPPTFLMEAARAVVAGFPRRPIEISPGCYVGAMFVVDACRELFPMPGDLFQPGSIRADVVERVRAYTEP